MLPAPPPAHSQMWGGPCLGSGLYDACRGGACAWWGTRFGRSRETASERKGDTQALHAMVRLWIWCSWAFGEDRGRREEERCLGPAPELWAMPRVGKSRWGGSIQLGVSTVSKGGPASGLALRAPGCAVSPQI